MNIKQITKKNGTIVYKTSLYLGVDQMTGKKARTTITANTNTSPKDVQHRLGHANIMMTQNTYWHTDQNQAKEAVTNYETAIKNL